MTEALQQIAKPACPHFGACGGCQHQDLAYPAQLALKQARLASTLAAAGLTSLPAITTHAAEPYHYRNRIRLRLERVAGQPHAGYNHAHSTDFLPIATCPIAAPILWQTAQAFLALAAEHREAALWFEASDQLELFCDHDAARVQFTLLCNQRKAPKPASFTAMMQALAATAPHITTAAAVTFDPRTATTGRTLATHGAAGLAYRVLDETYWISRGAFFQVNRFLLPALVHLVTANRSGQLAFDLFAGVGLFSRILAHSFHQVTGVEASPTAATDLRNALAKLSPASTAVEATTLDFLRTAILQRERPSLIVLDPPRAGAGLEACGLLNRLAPTEIVYVSCDPSTLARDLATLAPHYTLIQLHLLDQFPQTSHIETVALLTKK
jgi:23S rRNA (uracil1939-C5)-methyltransferase